ncbi:MAG TPA: hypothetical protein VFQ07_06410 [Candidatus Polarisedimenticolia bacterium]|nr:hypothetical protein [Candidatus Polarisedimenticolia bacterium]
MTTLAMAILFFPATVLAAYPGANGRILYVDRGNVGAHLIVVNSDGTNPVDLTGSLAMEIGRATWSPDGTRIAFTGYPLESSQDVRLYLADETGAPFQEVPIAPVRDAGNATWSPDGTRIAFSGVNDSGFHALFVVNTDGTGLAQVSSPADEFIYFSLAWSPRGDALLFAGLLIPPCPVGPCSTPDSDAEVYLFTLSSGVVTRLTVNGVLEETASWSPDGGRVVFDRIVQDGPCSLVVLDLATRQETDVSPSQSPNRCSLSPAWSPDGSSIAYISSTTVHQTDNEVFVKGVRGKGKHAITGGPYHFWPDWQPVPE